MRNKVLNYLGLAQKARKLVSGYNTCIAEMKKGKVFLLIITEGVGANSRKKLIDIAQANSVSYRLFGKSEEVSKAVGKSGKGIFAIKDFGFAEAIKKEIDGLPKGEVFEWEK